MQAQNGGGAGGPFQSGDPRNRFKKDGGQPGNFNPNAKLDTSQVDYGYPVHKKGKGHMPLQLQAALKRRAQGYSQRGGTTK